MDDIYLSDPWIFLGITMDMTKVNVLRNNNLISQPLTFHEFVQRIQGKRKWLDQEVMAPLDLKK